MGTITANGTEQTLFESSETGEFSGYVDLFNMDGDVTIVIRVYVKIKSGVDYRKWGQESYTGIQDKSALRITQIQSAYGYKCTLQQTAGSYKNYDYIFFKR